MFDPYFLTPCNQFAFNHQDPYSEKFAARRQEKDLDLSARRQEKDLDLSARRPAGCCLVCETSTDGAVGKVHRRDSAPVAPVRSRWLDAMLHLDRIVVATTRAIANSVGETGASNEGVQVLYALLGNPAVGQSSLVDLLGCDPGQLSRTLMLALANER